MIRVEASAAAAQLFDLVPGLRQRVENTLQSVCETAVELRRLRGKSFALDDRFMLIRVGDFVVSYILDLEIPAARVMRMEPASGVVARDRAAGGSRPMRRS